MTALLHAGERFALAGLLVAACAGIALNAAAQVTQHTRTGSVALGAAPPVRVEVFLNSTMQVQNAAGAAVYFLDSMQLLEAELSQGLPANEEDAIRVAQERMRHLGPALHQRAAHAATGITLAVNYGIDRVPAIVLDGQAIVYGVTDVSRAVATYRRQQATKGR
jgi:integrating conjugative element protein (TIGR03757 family)